jgi:hypothetical protein
MNLSFAHVDLKRRIFVSVDFILECRIEVSGHRKQRNTSSSPSFLKQPSAVEILNFRAGTFDGSLSRTLPPLAEQYPNGCSGRLAENRGQLASDGSAMDSRHSWRRRSSGSCGLLCVPQGPHLSSFCRHVSRRDQQPKGFRCYGWPDPRGCTAVQQRRRTGAAGARPTR